MIHSRHSREQEDISVRDFHVFLTLWVPTFATILPTSQNKARNEIDKVSHWIPKDYTKAYFKKRIKQMEYRRKANGISAICQRHIGEKPTTYRRKGNIIISRSHTKQAEKKHSERKWEDNIQKIVGWFIKTEVKTWQRFVYYFPYNNHLIDDKQQKQYI